MRRKKSASAHSYGLPEAKYKSEAENCPGPCSILVAPLLYNSPYHGRPVPGISSAVLYEQHNMSRRLVDLKYLSMMVRLALEIYEGTGKCVVLGSADCSLIDQIGRAYLKT